MANFSRAFPTRYCITIIVQRAFRAKPDQRLLLGKGALFTHANVPRIIAFQEERRVKRDEDELERSRARSNDNKSRVGREKTPRRRKDEDVRYVRLSATRKWVGRHLIATQLGFFATIAFIDVRNGHSWRAFKRAVIFAFRQSRCAVRSVSFFLSFDAARTSVTTGIACDPRRMLTSNLRHDNEHSAVNLEPDTVCRCGICCTLPRFYNLDREYQSPEGARDRFAFPIVCSIIQLPESVLARTLGSFADCRIKFILGIASRVERTI